MEHTESFATAERLLFSKAKQNKLPLNGSLELLPLCNMNCDMCYVRLSREEMERQGHLRSVDEWLTVAEQMKKAGTLFLLLTGGEPLLYPDFKKLYLKLLEMGMIITINTNGTLIDEEYASFFGAHKPRRINITLYGADEQAYTDLCHYPGGFDKVVNAITHLQKNGVDIKLSSSLTQANQSEMIKIIDFGNALNIPVRVDTYMLPAVRERNKPFNLQSRSNPVDAARIRIQCLKKEMGDELFSQYRNAILTEISSSTSENGYTDHVSCYAGNCSFTINWQGEMRPCVVMSEPSASVFDVGFEKAWKYIVEETAKITINTKCSRCSLRPLCRTCAACALLESGSYDGMPEYMCQYAEKSYEFLLESD